ncbi:MAG: hypothetical protein MMC33_006412 [Icmadophila ericetorum]|nr:hypothetical protein [Icmadophila ericetorum]
MRLSRGILLVIAAGAIAAPEKPEKRQDDNISELLQLASLAGVTALPTDPAVLLSLGPLANQLASELPTAPVLSVLETAAPSGFLSEIVHNPSFAASFESAFAAGSSPSWFLALPTSVKSYLHTYSDYVGVASAAGAIESVIANGTAANSTVLSAASSMTITSMMGTASTSGATATASGSGSGLASSTSTGGAPQASMLAAGLVGALGILGLAVAL